MIARSYMARSMVVEATEHFRRELEFFPFHRETRHDLGRTFLAMEKWDDAAAEYQFLCEMNAEDIRARNAWAQAVFNTGDYDLAKTILAPALTSDPPDAHVVMLQANIVDKLGDRAAAQVLFEQAKELRANEVAQEAEEL